MNKVILLRLKKCQTRREESCWLFQMNDKQHSLVFFQAQPEGLSLFFCPAALSLACVAPLHYVHSALPGKKTGSAGWPYSLRVPPK